MATLAQDFKMSTKLSELEKVGDFFGIGKKLVEQVESKLEEYAKSGEEWAKETADMWKDTAPWATGNLRDSIRYSVENPARPIVYVDKTLLNAHPRKLPTIRRAYRERGIDEIKMSMTDYVEKIDEGKRTKGRGYGAVSAGTEPQGAREDIWNAPHTPFIEPYWFRIADMYARDGVEGYKGRTNNA